MKLLLSIFAVVGREEVIERKMRIIALGKM